MSAPKSTLASFLLLFGAAAAASLSFPARARVYPLTVAVVGALLCLARLAVREASVSDDPAPSSPRDVLPFVLWVFAFVGVTAVLGLVVGAALFTFAFLVREGDVPFRSAAAAGLLTGLGLVAAGRVLGLRWPEALFDVVTLAGLG